MMRYDWALAMVVVAVMAVAAQQAPAPASDDEIWRDYLQWLRAAPAFDGPAESMTKYEASMKERGIPAEELRRRTSVRMRLMREREDAWPLIFDKIYSSANPNFSVKPSALLLSAVAGRPAGRALDVGMGQGRNAIALAIKGWQVTGFDLSLEGLNAANAQATRAGVTLTTAQQSVERFDMGADQWDLIAIIYGPGPLTDPAFAQRLHRALRQGGRVAVESFASNKTEARRRPVDVDPQDLRAAFEPLFQLVQFEDVQGTSEWDPQPTRLIRMVAQKK